jgi:hypothetical protein
MSTASAILGHGAVALGLVHSDRLRLLPPGAACNGYAEEVEGDRLASGARVPQLAIGSESITHVVHILRSEVAAVALDKVNTITLVDGGQRYRVRHFRNDPGRPEVDFYCALA